MEGEGDEQVLVAPARRIAIGRFGTPTLAELHTEAAEAAKENASSMSSLGGLTYATRLGDVRTLHRSKEAAAGAVFLAASQFNALEMVGPNVTPEHGVTGYVFDRTQGPACALACPGALAFRQFFAGTEEQHRYSAQGRGQAHGNQLDLLADVGAVLGNRTKLTDSRFWRVQV